MGGSCYRGEDRDMYVVGEWCENSCFGDFGGCEASMDANTTKPSPNCEYRATGDPRLVPINMQAVLAAINQARGTRRQLFLYTPDMFQSHYLVECMEKLPGASEWTYLAINAGVRSFLDSGWGFADLCAKGIREMWFGVESGDPILRARYDKPTFTNAEVIQLTQDGREAGVNVCWFLVDGVDDTDESRLATYELIRRAHPFRVQVGVVQRYDRAAERIPSMALPSPASAQ
jgi:hypothetical protein